MPLLYSANRSLQVYPRAFERVLLSGFPPVSLWAMRSRTVLGLSQMSRLVVMFYHAARAQQSRWQQDKALSVTHNRIRDASPLTPTCDQTSTKFMYPTLGKYAVAPWRLEAISSDSSLNSGLFANPSGNQQLSCSC